MKYLPSRIELLKQLPPGGVVAELGVYKGAFSRSILDICTPERLYMVDLWDALPNPWPNRHEQANNREAVKKEFGGKFQTSVVIEDTVHFLYTKPDAYFNWVYLDSAHGELHVLHELHAADRVVKRDGFICGHDYTNAVYNAGVIQAVEAFCEDTAWKIKYITQEDKSVGYPSFCLHIPGGEA